MILLANPAIWGRRQWLQWRRSWKPHQFQRTRFRECQEELLAHLLGAVSPTMKPRRLSSASWGTHSTKIDLRTRPWGMRQSVQKPHRRISGSFSCTSTKWRPWMNSMMFTMNGIRWCVAGAEMWSSCIQYALEPACHAGLSTTRDAVCAWDVSLSLLCRNYGGPATTILEVQVVRKKKHSRVSLTSGIPIISMLSAWAWSHQ